MRHIFILLFQECFQVRLKASKVVKTRYLFHFYSFISIRLSTSDDKRLTNLSISSDFAWQVSAVIFLQREPLKLDHDL